MLHISPAFLLWLHSKSEQFHFLYQNFVLFVMVISFITKGHHCRSDNSLIRKDTHSFISKWQKILEKAAFPFPCFALIFLTERNLLSGCSSRTHQSFQCSENLYFTNLNKSRRIIVIAVENWYEIELISLIEWSKKQSRIDLFYK